MQKLGKYRLLAPIASGGMAEVWLAEVDGPAGFVKQVALKLVRADRWDDPEMVRMFIQEANLASRLHHANIVHVFAFDQIGGRYAIAMELVHGRSLRAVLDRCRETGTRLGLPRAVHLAAEVAKALAYAHRPVEEGGVAGIVHRDVSPHNVLVSFEGEVKLTDFGIARAEDGSVETHPGTVKGKAGYMPPEQARGDPIDARADVFALGVVLWEMCAGRRLFARESEAATLAAVETAPVSPPSEWNEEVPPRLDALVLSALARDPSRRTASAEMAQALAEVGLRIARTPEERDLGPLMRRLWPLEKMRRVPGAGAAAAERPRLEAGRRPFALGMGVGVLASVLLAGALASLAATWWWRRAPAPAPSAARAALPELPGPPAPAPPTGEAKGPVRAPAAAEAPRAAAAGPKAALPEEAAPRRASPARPALPVVRDSSDRLLGLPTPEPASGDGVLFVNAVPWAEVSVDGEAVGDTPRELRLAAGPHRLRLSHPTLGVVERTVEVPAGGRVRLEPALR